MADDSPSSLVNSPHDVGRNKRTIQSSWNANVVEGGGGTRRSSVTTDDGGLSIDDLPFSTSSSLQDDSVRSNHADDYYNNNNNENDDDSAASSIHSLHSLESNEYINSNSKSKIKISSRSSSHNTHTGGGGGSQYSNDEDYSYYTTSDGDYEDDMFTDVDDDIDDMSLGFPPGHITTLAELNETNFNNCNNNTKKNNVNPSIIPSYFFCPLTKQIMRDPVITPSGITYERYAILRSLILYPNLDPTTQKSNIVNVYEDIQDDYMVKKSIDKFRKEAWVRYVVEFQDDDEHGSVNGNVNVVNAQVENVEEQTYQQKEFEQIKELSGGKVVEEENKILNEEEEATKAGKDQQKQEKKMSPSFPVQQQYAMAQRDGEEEAGKKHSSIAEEEIAQHEFQLHDSEQPSSPPQQQLQSPNPLPTQNVDISHNTSQDLSTIPSILSDTASTTNMTSSLNNNKHGWNVPLGVHRIICNQPGLVVTSDIHRRSNVVKRKIIKKSLAADGTSSSNSSILVGASGTTDNSAVANNNNNNDDITTMKKKKMISPKNKIKMKRKKMKKKKHNKKLKTITTVITRDLLLQPGTHVEILETCVHGGRVRGRIVWEEEVVTEIDHELKLRLEEEEVRQRAMARPAKQQQHHHHGGGVKSPSKMGKAIISTFHRKASNGMDSSQKNKKQALPFASDLFDQPPHNNSLPNTTTTGRGRRNNNKTTSSTSNTTDLSPSPLVTIKYDGWISLQWAGTTNNNERDEAMKRKNSLVKKYVVADDDEGPWSEPLPLGVYRIEGDNVNANAPGGSNNDGLLRRMDSQDSSTAGSSVKQLPLYDSSDSDSNIVDFLVENQCLEVVETRVLVMKTKKPEEAQDQIQIGTSSGTEYLSSNNNVGEQVVRARCMVPIIKSSITPENFDMGNTNAVDDAKIQQKFKSGWITLVGQGKGKKENSHVSASPIPLGAYIVTSADALLSCDSSGKVRSELPSGSCFEVVTTRIEFEEDKRMMKCRCGREGMYHAVAVRALIASGGYVTLFIASVGGTSTGTQHGSLCVCGQLVQHVVFAEPVPLGIYKMTHPAFLTQDILKSQVVTQLKENTCIHVIETKVEEGCVRGRVSISRDEINHGGALAKETVCGWVSLFEPPSFSWAEYISNTANNVRV